MAEAAFTWVDGPRWDQWRLVNTDGLIVGRVERTSNHEYRAWCNGSIGEFVDFEHAKTAVQNAAARQGGRNG